MGIIGLFYGRFIAEVIYKGDNMVLRTLEWQRLFTGGNNRIILWMTL